MKTLIVSGQNLRHLFAYHEKAIELFEMLVSPVMQSTVNGIFTFYVSPSGFKPGSNKFAAWEQSIDGFFAWCREDAAEQKIKCTVLEIEYGLGGERASVLRSL